MTLILMQDTVDFIFKKMGKENAVTYLETFGAPEVKDVPEKGLRYYTYKR